MTSVGATKAMTSPTRQAQGQCSATLLGASGAPNGHNKPKVCGCAASPQHAHDACACHPKMPTTCPHAPPTYLFSYPAVSAMHHRMLPHARLALVAGGVVVRLVMLWLSLRDGM
jgi:hypothetical protein